ncbi:MAG: malto-oligosyltrehalose trehalohydrolase [candidate division Zixibacteria bacterium]|nr:malto-oligosyltrehalose trehalohydrolase [candidate division Zixibacteria bacterium]
MKIGAYYKGVNKCEFTLWAPHLDRLDLKILSPNEQIVPMKKIERGCWHAEADDLEPGSRYVYRINDEHDKPDPASFYQPDGVHEPSQVVDHGKFKWDDKGWKGLPLEEMIFYETHIGTFTSEGTFDEACKRLDYLIDLGVNTIEIMPVAQFPGSRNWGYDGAYLYAVQNSYGGPEGLKYLVNECHKRDIAVCLDVVYNHLGPEGNYISQYCPYFTEKYHTPWGAAVNFDDAFSDGVRNFVIQNALYWFEHFHIDALRLDAIHGIFDMGAKHILKEMAEEVDGFCRKQGRRHYLIAESDLNDIRVIQPWAEGGYGMDGQWSDDFHHCMHTLLTGEDKGYYADFGKIDHLLKALREGFVYSWDYSVYRRRMHGSSSVSMPAEQFTVFIQNHDQVGNRMMGERLSSLVSFEALKLAAGVMLTSPYVPLLFMGEEYAEDNPFLYFVSHGDKDLINAVREGRKREFKAFGWEKEPPDPQSDETFKKSMPDFSKAEKDKHKAMQDYYKTLIGLRKENPSLAHLEKTSCEVWREKDLPVVCMIRRSPKQAVFTAANISDNTNSLSIPDKAGGLNLLVDSYDERWNGEGSSVPKNPDAGNEIKLGAHQFLIFESKA